MCVKFTAVLVEEYERVALNVNKLIGLPGRIELIANGDQIPFIGPWEAAIVAKYGFGGTMNQSELTAAERWITRNQLTESHGAEMG